MSAVTDLVLDPWLPLWLIAALLAVPLAFALYAALRGVRGQVWRVAFLALLGAALLNPSLTQEDRRPIDSLAVIVADRSSSLDIGERAAQRDAAVDALRAELDGMPGLAVRVVDAARDGTDETRLFDDLASALADVPRNQLAGILLVTDGQVHDAPDGPWQGIDVPIHALIAGSRSGVDRRISFVEPPAFGLVNQSVTLTVETATQPEDSPAPPPVVTLRRDGEVVAEVPVGRDGRATIEVPLVHGGQTVIEAEVPVIAGELTAANNHAAVAVNGVRDRLRVLLVSGEPHMGERVWRNILKSDPSVDLVHFTILRPPEGQDITPINELSLIAFPVRELFDVQINEFDLIIFDRYRRRGVLHQTYLENIAQYVENGGAFLEASGPDFANIFSLYRTPLERILPGRPTGTVIEAGFTPELTEVGRRHPVTAGLSGAGPEGGEPTWGRWFREIDVQAMAGDVLMSGESERPLLILNRVGQGRVAQVASDQMWLWARGFEGGGPQVELLRRVAHWLMREPSLEENLLTASADGHTLRISRRLLEGDPAGPVEVTGPDEDISTVTLEASGPGLAEAAVRVSQPGIYQVTDGERQALAVVGDLSSPEFTQVHATAERLAQVVAATGGGTMWLEDGVPDLRRVHPGRDTAGADWLGLVDRQNYQVTGARQTPLLPPWVAVLLILPPLILAWRAEGR